MSAQYLQVTIQDTEMHRLSSSYVDQGYNIFVALPPGYADSGKTYPTLYTTDGDLVFGAVTQIARLIAVGKTIPQLVVVGIGYPVHWTATHPCQILEGRGYGGLQLTLRVFEGQTHQSVIPYFLTGLAEVYG